ncbi:ABC transporter permease [Aerococcus urinaeequi]|uniref:ABC transporter permease n=1 Tax=Aerococcus urinaeequi TaxID=51665 RepID=UPI003D6A3D49
MKIFKLFYSLANAYRNDIIINIVILFAIAIPLSLIYTSNLNTTFDQVELKLGLVNHDQESLVTEHFVDYLSQQYDLVDLPDDEETIVDALYYENANYVLEIPEGFGDALLHNEDLIPLEKRVGPERSTETYADILINNYMTNFQYINTGTDDVNDPTAVNQTLQLVGASIADDIAVTTSESTRLDADTIGFGMSFTHLTSYTMIMTLITVFGLPMISMRNPEIMKRDRLGGISTSRRNTELFIACNLFGFALWLAIMVVGGLVYGFDTLVSSHGQLLLLSSFVAIFGIQQMAFFIVTVAPNKGMVSFFSTGISLLIAFTSGLFVPRDFTSPIMQQIAQVATPIWQVKTDEIILSAENLSQKQMTTIFQYMGIQLLIALAYMALTYIYRRYKQSASI